MAITYGNVYVAQVALGANSMQTIKAIDEAERYPGPSIIIGYTPCINHGVKGGMVRTLDQAKEAVESGYWPLYRYNPELVKKGKDPMVIDYKKTDFDKMRDFLEKQTRYSALHTIKQNQEVVEHLLDKTKEDAIERSESYNKLVTHMKKKNKASYLRGFVFIQ